MFYSPNVTRSSNTNSSSTGQLSFDPYTVGLSTYLAFTTAICSKRLFVCKRSLPVDFVVFVRSGFERKLQFLFRPLARPIGYTENRHVSHTSDCLKTNLSVAFWVERYVRHVSHRRGKARKAHDLSSERSDPVRERIHTESIRNVSRKNELVFRGGRDSDRICTNYE